MQEVTYTELPLHRGRRNTFLLCDMYQLPEGNVCTPLGNVCSIARLLGFRLQLGGARLVAAHRLAQLLQLALQVVEGPRSRTMWTTKIRAAGVRRCDNKQRPAKASDVGRRGTTTEEDCEPLLYATKDMQQNKKGKQKGGTPAAARATSWRQTARPPCPASASAGWPAPA